MTAVEIIDDDHFIGAEHMSNLIICRRNADAAADAERAQLKTVGEYHHGDFINVIRHGAAARRAYASMCVRPRSRRRRRRAGTHTGSLAMYVPEAVAADKAAMAPSPSLLFAGHSGAVYVLATLPPALFYFLAQLQERMSKAIRGVGGFTHELYPLRRLRHTAAPARRCSAVSLNRPCTWRSFRNEHKVAPASGFIDGDLIEAFLDLSATEQQQVCAAGQGGRARGRHARASV